MKIRPRSLLLAAGLLLIVTSCVWFGGAVIRARDTARCVQCKANVFQITYAMHVYHDVHGEFPPAYILGPNGEPWHSWRVLLLPYVDQVRLYEEYRFDEPWNGPNNRKLLERMPRVYACPSDPQAASEFRTNYYVIVGDDTAFPGSDAISLDAVETDRSETFAVVESATLRALWMQPQDFSVEAMSLVLNDRSKPSISSHHYDGVSISNVDGTARLLPPHGQNSIEPEVLRARCLIRPAQPAVVP